MKWPVGYTMNVTKLLNSPIKIFFAGLFCVLLGFILPLLIVIGIIENSFALSFFIYIMQLVGMILGVIAAAGLALKSKAKQARKKRKQGEEQESTTKWME
jgi:hypothetical protein